MIKLFHEAPKCIFSDVQENTQGDYCLVHLAEEDPDYAQLFLDAREQGREVILDNSIFELGTSFDPYKYSYWIEKLKPTYYIIPDVLEDTNETLQQARHWKETFSYLPGKTIGVVQGKTFTELVKCIRVLKEEIKVDKLAISFDYSYYLYTFPHPNKWVSYMMGRVKLIGDLVEIGALTGQDRVHLLGCALSIEGMFYGDYNFIESVDTSNPVVHALKGIAYKAGLGLNTKETQKLCDLINFPEEYIDREILSWNLYEFNKYWNGKHF